MVAVGLKSPNLVPLVPKLGLLCWLNNWVYKMADLKLRKWDSSEHIKSEDIALYLETCFEEAGDDAAFIAKALGNVANARGMTQLAKDCGRGRESLYKALSGEGNPSFATILKVMKSLNLELHVSSAAQ